MSSLPAYLRATNEGARLSLKVQPRASHDGIGGEQAGELKVKVTAPPVDSAANEAVVRLLADTLGCSRGAVTLIRGQTSRHKVIQVCGVTAAAIAERLASRQRD